MRTPPGQLPDADLTILRAHASPAWAALYRGDAFALLPRLFGCFQALVADPPYGIGYVPGGGARHKFAGVGIAGDDRPFDPRPLLATGAKRIVLFGANHFASRLPDSPGWICWDKREGLASIDFADGELAWTNARRPLRMIRRRWNGADRGSERGEHWHPTQKPRDVMRLVLEELTAPDDVICDPFMGSGTTGLAALDLGRSFIGIEIEPRWYAAAVTRVSAAAAQGPLLL